MMGSILEYGNYKSILLALLICIVFISNGCKVNDSLDPGNPDEIEAFIIQAYEKKFGLELQNPAYSYSSDFNRYTSTAYYNQNLYRLYILDNGKVLAQQTKPLMPRGNTRVLCIVVDYPNLEFSKLKDNLWTEAQESINNDHLLWANRLNLDQPLLQFSNNTLLIEPGIILNPSKSVLDSVASANGRNPLSYDVIAFVDLNQNEPSGGFAVLKANWIKIGWFYREDQGKELTSEKLRGIAYAIYHHEIGHLFGWEHEWSDASESDLFITDPKLFGWEDLDNDGEIEILDSTPYGINQ